MTFFALFRDFELYLNITKIKYLNLIILDDSDRPNRIVQMNKLRVICSIIHINIVKIVKGFTPGYIHQGINVFDFKANFSGQSKNYLYVILC